MKKYTPWPLVLLIVTLLFAAILAAGQAITFAWLSAFSEREFHIHSLEIKFWSYAIASVVLVLIDLALLVLLIRQNKKSKESKGTDLFE
jgi:heme/copper-type cytochrome/quinol oxidase subunit 2